MTHAQKEDEELKKIICNATHLKPQIVRILILQDIIVCEMSTETARPYIPKKFRNIIFLSVHALSQPAAPTTVKTARKIYCWKLINNKVATLAQTCASF